MPCARAVMIDRSEPIQQAGTRFGVGPANGVLNVPDPNLDDRDQQIRQAGVHKNWPSGAKWVVFTATGVVESGKVAAWQMDLCCKECRRHARIYWEFRGTTRSGRLWPVKALRSGQSAQRVRVVKNSCLIGPHTAQYRNWPVFSQLRRSGQC
jgi:hypothetical protein